MITPPSRRHQILAQVPPGAEIGVSDWVVVDQPMIDGFAEVTRDPDPMHIDPSWAAAQGPFNGSIAFGFLTVSLLTHLLHSAMGTAPDRAAEDGHYLNYGFNRLRLVEPVPAGSRIRGRFAKREQVQDEKGRWRVTFDCTIEIEGRERPALVAEWLSVWVPGDGE